MGSLTSAAAHQRLLATALVALSVLFAVPRVVQAAQTSATSPTAPTANPPASPAAQTVDQFHADLRNGNTLDALQLLSPDVFIAQQGFVNKGRDQYAGGRVANDAAFAKGVADQQIHRDVIKISPTAAEVITQSHRTGTFHKITVDLVQAETALVEKRGDKWQIVAIHWSAHPEHTPSANAPEKGSGK